MASPADGIGCRSTVDGEIALWVQRMGEGGKDRHPRFRIGLTGQVDAIIADLIKNGPTEAELQRAKMQDVAGTIRGLESVGGFSGKAVTLAQGEVYANDPDFYKKELESEVALTPAEAQKVASKWLSRPVFSYTLSPGQRSDKYEEASGVGAGNSRSGLARHGGWGGADAGHAR